MPIYEARLDGAIESITADTLDSALEQAEEWIRDGNWDASDGPVHVTGYLVEIDADGDETRHQISIAIEQDEPSCIDGIDGDHDWQSPIKLVGGCKESPGVYGHGGGVTIQEVCLRCGCGRLTDTWATNRTTGEQGLRSVTYTPDKYDVSEYESDAA